MRRSLVLSLGLLSAACNPYDFKNTLKEAPVQVLDVAPVRAMLALDPPAEQPKIAARVLLSSGAARSLAVADFDSDGNTTITRANSSDLADLGSTKPIMSMAKLSNGTVVLGIPQFNNGERVLGQIALLTLSNESATPVFHLSPTTKEGSIELYGSALGLAVATGQVTGIQEEIAVLSESTVSVFSPTNIASPILTPVACGTLKTPNDSYRSMVVANLLAGGIDEIAVGFPVLGGKGYVQLISYGTSPKGTTELYCSKRLDTPNNGGGFGASLAAADFNGDGFVDLAVGAPPDRVFVYFGPLTGGAPSAELTMEHAINFGARVTAVNLDSSGAQLLVSDIGATVGDTMGAGKAYLYKFDKAGSQRVAMVNDSSPSDQSYFGTAAAAVPFRYATCPKGAIDTRVLVSSSDSAVFAFFRFVDSLPDPRCFARK
jgi:hypothetical protein